MTKGLAHCLLLILLAAPISLQARNPATAKKPVGQMLQQADIYYENHRYRDAYKLYIELARIGSKHAQHRAAELLFRGKGHRKNPIKAYKWAWVSAEFNQPAYIELRNRIYASLPAEARQKAQRAAKDHYDFFNDRAIAVSLIQKTRQKLRLESIFKTGPNGQVNFYRMGHDGVARPVSIFDELDNFSREQQIILALEKYVYGEGQVELGPLIIHEDDEPDSADKNQPAGDEPRNPD